MLFMKYNVWLEILIGLKGELYVFLVCRVSIFSQQVLRKVFTIKNSQKMMFFM